MKSCIILLLSVALLASPVYAQGDTDGDGIPDSVDLCPREPGPRENRGCPLPTPTPPPDRDGDGLPDSVDRCPSEPGPRENNGCPVQVPTPSDRDGDTVTDDVDQCPDQPGPRENFGCPVRDQPTATSAPLPATSAPLPTRPPYRPAPPPDTQNCYATPATETNVNVREQPTTQGRVVRSLTPNAHLLVLDTAFDPQGQTWFQVQLPEGGLAFVADVAVEVQGSCANLPGVTLVPQGGSLPPSLCFIDPSKVAGNLSAAALDDYTVIANPSQANPETGNLLLSAALVTVSQPARATFTAQPLPNNIPWASAVPVATFLRVTIYDTNFQQTAYQEVPLGQALNVDLPAGDYYWLFQMDTAGASLSIRCEPQPEQTSPGYMPICALFDSAPNGELINPRPIDKMPLVDGQNQPNEAAAYVLEFPNFVVYKDILLRVLTLGSSPVKAMLFVPSVQLYQSETTIPAGSYADIAVPQGVYTLEFFSAAPFDINALCWPGDTPPEVMGTPAPAAAVGEAIGFIMGDCVAAAGFGENGAPLNPFSFDPMNPLTLDYWEPDDNGIYFNDIKYLIASVPVQVFFNTLSSEGTLNVYVYDIAKGGVLFNSFYPANGNYNLALPAGVFYMSFSSDVPGRAVVNCLTMPAPPPGAGAGPFDLPDLNGPLSTYFGLPLYGFEGFTPTEDEASDGSVRLVPRNPALPTLVLTRMGDGSVRVAGGADGRHAVRLGDGSVQPDPNDGPTLLLNTGLLLGDGSVIPFDLLAGDGSVLPSDPAAGDGSVLPILGVVVGFQALDADLETPEDLGGIVLQTPNPAFVISGNDLGLDFGLPDAENLVIRDACEPVATQKEYPCNPLTMSAEAFSQCVAQQNLSKGFSTGFGAWNMPSPDFEPDKQKSFLIYSKPMQVNRPARLTAQLFDWPLGGAPTFDLSGIAVSVQAFRADGSWFTQVEFGQDAASVDLPRGQYTHFRGSVVRLGPPVSGSAELRLTCEAR